MGGGIVVYCCAGIGGATFAFIGIADGWVGGPAGQAITVGSYCIVKGVNRDAQEGHWTIGVMSLAGGYMYCGGAC